MSFSSPHAALAQLVDCLTPLCDDIHTGPLGSGVVKEPLVCKASGPCGCLLRIETAGTIPKDYDPTVLATTGCRQFIQRIVLNYLTCFPTIGDRGQAPKDADVDNASDRILTSWWNALGLLACCNQQHRSDITGFPNQQYRFVSQDDRQPEGGCAGWTITLETDVQMCDCGDLPS